MDRKQMQRMKLGLRYAAKYVGDRVFLSDSRNRVLSKPLDILCEISYACNLKCPTCFRWTSTPDLDEMGPETWKRIITDLKSWAGTFFLSFSGGEPFLRNDLLDIIDFASRQGLLVSAISNGSLIDGPLARRIVSSGLDVLNLSLNSLKPEIHNRMRGIDTSFNDVMTAIGNLKDRGTMRLMISVTITSENINDLEELAEFVQSEGLNGINFQPLMEASTFPVYDKDGKTANYPEGMLYRDLGKNTEKIDDIFNRLIAMKEKGCPITNSGQHLKLIARYLLDPADPAVMDAICKIGAKNFFIDPFGNVRICSVMEPIGNIANKTAKKIWNSDKAQNQREMIRNCRKACSLLNCNFKELDLGSRVRRYLMRRDAVK